MDITGIMQAVRDALEARDRRIAELEKALASNMDRMLEHVEALEKAQADNAAYQERLKSILVGICPVPDPECSVAEECDISGTCQAMHALLAADHPGAEFLVLAREQHEALLALAEHLVDLADCDGNCATCSKDEREECAACDVLTHAGEALARGKAQGWGKPEPAE
jgi:hypothetical protein